MGVGDEMVKVLWDVDHAKYKGNVTEAIMSRSVAEVLESRGRLAILGPAGEEEPPKERKKRRIPERTQEM